MVGLSRVVRRYRWVVIGLWVALVAFSVPFARSNGGRLNAGVTGVDGSQSQAVQNALDSGEFGSAGYPQIGVVVEPASGATAQDVENAVDRISRAAGETDHVLLSSQSLATAQEQAAAVQPFVVPLTVTETLAKSVGPTNDFIDALDPGVEQNLVTTYVVGQSALQAEQSNEATAGADAASVVSLPVILILLLATFGAIVAALVPLLLGFASVMVTGMAVYFLSESLSISIYATSLAAMIGLAVAVDYSLFILMRYREESRRGATRVQALETAMSTSAVAVMFSGTTVIVSLAGLFLMPNATVRWMALASIIVVAVSLLGAATLLPALITVFGHTVEGPGRVGRALALVTAALRGRAGTPFWQRVTALVTRSPWLTISAVLVVLLVVAWPLLRMDLNVSTLLQLPTANQARVGTTLAGDVAGPGSTGPALVLVQFDSGTASAPANQQVLGEVQAVLAAQSSLPTRRTTSTRSPSSFATRRMGSARLRRGNTGATRPTENTETRSRRGGSNPPETQPHRTPPKPVEHLLIPRSQVRFLPGPFRESRLVPGV
jgi:uncharacterized membrane protein YdfJ with MMPL/SSD domain